MGAECPRCDGRGVILNADEYDEQCPDCAVRGIPDPLTRAERQVAAVRQLSRTLRGDTLTTTARTPSDLVEIADLIDAALETP